MIPKKNKITKNVFSSSLLTSKTIHDPLFTLKFKEFEGFESLCAVVVPKAVFKKAHDRNLLKRRGYEVIEKSFKNIKKPYILMFFAKKDAKNASFEEIETSLNSLLSKIKPSLFI